MNHIGNANKMVSETPISDSTPHNVADLGMQIRRLERKLNAANAEIERLTAKVAQLYEGAEEQTQRIKRLEEENNELRAEEARLLNTNGELERRIKRLEAAGDAMFLRSTRVGREIWKESKEAKP